MTEVLNPSLYLNVFAPTQEAFRRISVLADAERQKKITDGQFREYMQVADTLGTAREWISPIIPTMNLRARGAQIRGEEILAIIGQYEANAIVDTTEQKLGRFEKLQQMLVHPDVGVALQQAIEALQARGFKDVVIIPGGSSVYGGMIIRDLFASEQPAGQDIDMLVQVDSSNNPDLSAVEECISQAIYGVTSTIHPNRPIYFTLDSHKYFVPSNPGGNYPKVQEKDIWNVLWTYHPSAVMELFDSIAQCFSVTYPLDYGIKIRRVVLSSLKQLYRTNPQQWERVVEGLIDTISPEGPLMKDKYVSDRGSVRSLIVQGIDNRLQTVREDIVEDLLYSTGK